MGVIGALGRGFAWLVLLFFVIVAILALTAGLPNKIHRAREQAESLDQVARSLTASTATFEEAARTRAGEADRELDRLRRASSSQLDEAERVIIERRRSANDRVIDSSEVAFAALKGQSDRIIASYKAQYVELPLADRTLAFIALRQSNIDKVTAHRGQLARLHSGIISYNRRLTAYRLKQAGLERQKQQAADERRNRLCQQVVVPGLCKNVRRIRESEKELAEERNFLVSLKQQLEAKRGGLKGLQAAAENAGDAAAIVARATTAFQEEARRTADASSSRVWNISRAAIRKHGQRAFGILLTIIFLPLIYKLIAFFVIAPRAARAPPLRILSGTNPLLMGNSHSFVDVLLDPDTELFVRTGVQSAAASISGRDVPVLDWRMLLTCIAAGLTNLQRLRSDQPDHVRVVAHDDQLAEVAIVEVPAGGAAVLQPRALVGVLKSRSDRLRIDRIWRLNLASWLTFQLRYVIFRGPCSLIIRGRRGIAAEYAARGRMINRRLTLGFDAGLAYGVARTATVMPYLRGKDSLFNDRFAGQGQYLYEQHSATAAGGPLWGRGLKGLRDGVLSGFGI